MKKIMMMAAMAACVLASCNQSAPKVDEKSQTAETGGSDLKIAYIEVDSIMSQYQFCKEYSLILQKKSQNIQKLSMPTLLSSRTICRPFRTVLAVSSRLRPTSSTMLFVTVSSTSLLNIIKTRSML